jgi:hypothetical protein
MTATPHTCNRDKPGKALPFGRRGPGCARCTELDNGATRASWTRTSRSQEYARQAADLQAHFVSKKHRTGGCGIVCTFGDA